MNKSLVALSRDPVMKMLIRLYGELTLAGSEPTEYFSDLAKNIIGQQLSGKAADTITARVLALMGGSFGTKKIISQSEQSLREAGMSYNKIAYMKNLSRAVLAKSLDLENIEDYGDDEIIAQITAIKGLGNWTAEMFLIFSLARGDVYSLGDGGLSRSVNILYGRGKLLGKEEIKKISEKWKPYRSLACLYLWKSLHNR